MKILVAPNAMKGSVDAFEAARSIAAGLAKAMPGATLVELPVADGGDGTARVLVHACDGEMVEAEVTGPLGDKVRARWGFLGDLGGVRTGVVEVAAAAGLTLVPAGQRDPLVTTSHGAGDLIRAALDRGCRRIFVGVGGSATVEGGAGLLQSLGVRLLDAGERSIAPGGAGLGDISRIDPAGVDGRIETTEIVVICDVDNPLLGEAGAARVFGPQKGASPVVVARLEANLDRFAAVIKRDLGRDVRSMKHGGAAGGMAAGIAGVLGGQLVEGAERVLDLLRFEARLAGCDLVVTAEGLLDRQTLDHKAPWEVARRARQCGVPVVVLAGGIADEVTPEAFGMFDAIVPICARPMGLAEAMARTNERLFATAEQMGRLLGVGAAVALDRS